MDIPAQQKPISHAFKLNLLMTQPLQRKPADLSLSRTITQLASEASIEINVQDLKDLPASRAFLPPGQRIYVSYLPRQTWQQTEAACRAVKEAGFDPIPHVPVRQIASESMLARLLDTLIASAQVKDILLIAGDYSQAVGPYSQVAEVLRSGVLSGRGLRAVSFAGHPEGHPKIPLEEIRRAEREKAQVAADLGLEVTFVTQFFFEPKPFLDWAQPLRAADVNARLVAGLAGPARLTTLFKYALRCGAGPSIRALGARPESFLKLMGDHGPQTIVRALAEAHDLGTSDFSGLHFFCFGGYLRTCEWVHRIASGQFTLNDAGGFDVSPSAGSNERS